MKKFIEWLEDYATHFRSLEINPNFSNLAQRIEFILPSKLKITYNNGDIQVFDEVKYQTVLDHSRRRSHDDLIRRLQTRDNYLHGRIEPSIVDT